MKIGDIGTSPRVISLAWAIWAWSTAAAYWDVTPSQLDPVAALLPGNWVFWAWTIAATMLTAGAAIPGTRISRAARITGLSLTAGLLISWGMAYIWETLQHGNRMWVSAKNYIFMALVALGTSQLIGRARNPTSKGVDG